MEVRNLTNGLTYLDLGEIQFEEDIDETLKNYLPEVSKPKEYLLNLVKERDWI